MKITIEDLETKLENWIRQSGGVQTVNIHAFYIGKSESKNFEKRKQKHESEGYNGTLEIAHGKAETVELAETRLAEYFQTTDLKNKLINVDPKANGNNKADTLYVAYKAHLVEGKQLSIDDLDDPEILEWPESYELQ